MGGEEYPVSFFWSDTRSWSWTVRLFIQIEIVMNAAMEKFTMTMTPSGNSTQLGRVLLLKLLDEQHVTFKSLSVEPCLPYLKFVDEQYAATCMR